MGSLAWSAQALAVCRPSQFVQVPSLLAAPVPVYADQVLLCRSNPVYADQAPVFPDSVSVYSIPTLFMQTTSLFAQTTSLFADPVPVYPDPDPVKLNPCLVYPGPIPVCRSPGRLQSPNCLGPAAGQRAGFCLPCWPQPHRGWLRLSWEPAVEGSLLWRGGAACSGPG